GGAVLGRRAVGARLPESAGTHGGAVRARSVWAAGEPVVPDGRPDAVVAGRRDGVPGTDGLPSEGARVPDRAGRDRGGTGETSGCRDRSGGGAGGGGGRQAVGCILRRGGAGGGGAADVSERASAGV